MASAHSPMPYAIIILAGTLIGALVEHEELTSDLESADNILEITIAVFAVLVQLVSFHWLSILGAPPLLYYTIAVILWLGLVLGIVGTFT